MPKMTRRDFLTSVSSAAALGAISPLAFPASARAAAPKSKVVIVATADRKKGVVEAMRLLKVASPKGKSVLIKPNFNTADAAPGSTHNDTLQQLIAEIWERDAKAVTIGESSGPPDTKKVMTDKGIFDLAHDLRTSVVNYDSDLADSDWVPVNPPGTHWGPGELVVPRLIAQSPYVVSTCCLKTHAYGGVVSMSLKLGVGITPEKIRRGMHQDKVNMRRRIAEINAGYTPRFIVMDGVDAFVDGGPSSGKRVSANVMVAGTDRVAVDAVGVAILKELGSNAAIMDKKIFEQEQIQRAVELGLGVSGPEQIDLVTGDAESRAWAEKIKAKLALG